MLAPARGGPGTSTVRRTACPSTRRGRCCLDALGRRAGRRPAGVVAYRWRTRRSGTLQPSTRWPRRPPRTTSRCSRTPPRPPDGWTCPDGWAAAAASAHKWGGPAGVGVLAGAQGRPVAGAVPHRRPDRPRGSPGSRTCRPRSPRQLRSRPWWPSATRSPHASARWSTGSGRVARRWRTWTWSATPCGRLPHVLTFSCLYVDGEALVTELDRRGFAVASGSACTASTLEPSHVLAAMGALTHGNVRVSLARDTTDGRGGAAARARCRRCVADAPRPDETAPMDADVELDCRGHAVPAAGHPAGQQPRRRRGGPDGGGGRRGPGGPPGHRGVVPDARARSTSARTSPTTGSPASWCGGLR